MSRPSGALCALAACLLIQSAPSRAQTITPSSAPLLVEEVLNSVDRALPLLEQARQEVRAAQGSATEARGAFDLSVKADVLSVRGFYDNDRGSTVLEQPLSAFGMNVFGGYRSGRGVFAPYDGKAQTLSEGEVMAGVDLPLLRGRAVDARRVDRLSADLGVDVARHSLDNRRLTFFKNALWDYWDWVASGHQRQVAQALLDLAAARDQQLADAIALGQIAPVERLDNQRAILQRRSAVVAAQRGLEQEAIDLSLYLRGVDGQPMRPPLARLPELPPAGARQIDDEAMLLRLALERRPELQAIRARRAQQAAELTLARNTLLPTLDLFSVFSKDAGSGPASRAGSSFEGGVAFSVPLQRRKARGNTLQAEAKLSAIDQELRWTEDLVRADVQDALSAVAAARAVLDVIAQEVAVARELEGLERERFQLGDSTQFLVNLRELATADAAVREVRARADYHKALVTLEAATGQLLQRVP